MKKPVLIVSAPEKLFASFFADRHQRRLARTFDWRLNSSRTTSPALRRQLAIAEALITTWDSPRFGDELLRFAPQLRVIAHCGGEVKNRFTGTLLDKLTVTTAPEPMARATAELAAALVLYCGRGIDEYRSLLRMPRNRIYDDVHCNGTPEFLIGRELGMIGFGRIGRRVVDLLRGFDFRWQIYDPNSTDINERSVEFVTLQTVLRRSNILVLTAALTDETRGMLNRKNLSRLPDGATIINVARGGLVDLKALTREVRNKRLRCAIDVSDPLEPLPEKHPLRRMPGAILTPHIGGGSEKARHEMADQLIDDLERFWRGEAVKNQVTTAMLARMT